MMLRPGVELRRRCSRFWTTARTRRDAGRHGGHGGLIVIVDCIQIGEEGAAGAVQGVGELRDRTPVSISCTLEQAKGSGRCAEAERVEGGQKEAAASPGGAGIGQNQRRRLHILSS
jgi:hypothetical protein